MAVLFVMSVISLFAIAFLVRFFIALCQERTEHTWRLVRVSPDPINWNGERCFHFVSTTLLHRL